MIVGAYGTVLRTESQGSIYLSNPAKQSGNHQFSVRAHSSSAAADALRCGGRGFFGAPTSAYGSLGVSGSRLKNRLILSAASRIL